jgi:hypothetical protein
VLAACVLEKRLVVLFGPIEVVFAQVVPQEQERIVHQRHSAHLAAFSHKAQLSRWIQSHISN